MPPNLHPHLEERTPFNHTGLLQTDLLKKGLCHYMQRFETLVPLLAHLSDGDTEAKAEHDLVEV